MSRFDCGACVLRPWRGDDLESLLAHANNAHVSRGLRDRFPFPYTRADGEAFLALPAGTEWRFAIEVDGCAVGGIGVRPGEDVHRIDAEVGYWLGEALWGRGIVSAALNTLVPRAFEQLDLERVHAGVYSNNPASMRVLEKAGFAREGVMRRAVVKRGEVLDLVMYARLRC